MVWGICDGLGVMPLLGFTNILIPSEGVFLHGSEGSPIEINHESTDPEDAAASFFLIVTTGANAREKGYMMSLVYDFSDAGNVDFIKINPETDWVNPHDFDPTYWVRATLVAGTNPFSGVLGNWQSLIPDDPDPYGGRGWTWIQVQLGATTGTVKVEVASDSEGANILATGYYKATVTVV